MSALTKRAGLERTFPEPKNFSNGTWPNGEVPPTKWTKRRPAVDLRRVLVTKTSRFRSDRQVEEFELLLPICYQTQMKDADGNDVQVKVTVPQADGDFQTDLTSVPAWFTWLVPKSGRHLPAALVHDGLVHGATKTYLTEPAGLVVDRIDADRIFRDAMRDTHVGLVRRWLVWSAVAIASLISGPRPRERWNLGLRVYFVLLPLATLAAIAYLGAAATFDLAGRVPERLAGLPWMGDLPWIPDGPWWEEALRGWSGAVVVPGLLGLLWGRYFKAGAIAGVALATLVHVTVAVGLVALIYQAAEWIAGWKRAAPWVLLIASISAVLIFWNSIS